MVDAAGLTNVSVREYVRCWAKHTGAARVEVVSAADDQRLVAESLEAGDRRDQRPADAGAHNNWRPSSEMEPLLEGLMAGASVGKTMSVIPYLVAPQGSPLEKYLRSDQWAGRTIWTSAPPSLDRSAWTVPRPALTTSRTIPSP